MDAPEWCAELSEVGEDASPEGYRVAEPDGDSSRGEGTVERQLVFGCSRERERERAGLAVRDGSMDASGPLKRGFGRSTARTLSNCAPGKWKVS